MSVDFKVPRSRRHRFRSQGQQECVWQEDSPRVLHTSSYPGPSTCLHITPGSAKHWDWPVYTLVQMCGVYNPGQYPHSTGMRHLRLFPLLPTKAIAIVTTHMDYLLSSSFQYRLDALGRAGTHNSWALWGQAMYFLRVEDKEMKSMVVCYNLDVNCFPETTTCNLSS